MDTPEEQVTPPALRAAHQQVEDLKRQLAQSRQALEDLTHSVSHDLRAPLRHVSAYLKILREDLGDAVPADILGHLHTASDAATTLARLIDGLLELSRIGRAELQQTCIALQPLLEELHDKLGSESAGRRVEWQLAPDLPAVRGDLALVAQLLEHLLGNALKFTRGAEPARIAVGWRALPDGWCELQIQDNGAGFDPRFNDRLFKVFQRLHSSKQFEGIGVGLALSRLIVERHGGRIQAEGILGGGCKISVTLPLALSDPEAAAA